MVFVIGKKSKISNIFAKNFIGKTPVFFAFFDSKYLAYPSYAIFDFGANFP